MLLLGRRIRAARIATGFAEGADFAEAVGIEPTHYQRIEAGQDNPDLTEIIIVAQTTGRSIDFLVTGRPYKAAA